MTFRKLQNRVLLLLVFLTTLLGFNTLFGELQFDDNVTILGDDCIKDLGLLARLILGGEYFQRSILRATFSLNYHLGNIHPFGYHLFNILFHAWNGILVFSLCGQLMALLPGTIKEERPRWKRMTSRAPVLSSLIFLLLPIQTETTAYISSRSSSVASFFYLLGISCFLGFLFHGRSGGGTRWVRALFGLMVCFLLGVGAKEEFFTFPILLLVIYFFHGGRHFRCFIRENKVLILTFFLVPLLFLSFRGYNFFQDYQSRSDYWREAYHQELENRYVASEVEFILKRGLYSVFGLESGYAPAMYSPYAYLLTEMAVVPKYYLRKIIFPFELNLDPDFPVTREVDSRTLLSIFFITGFLGMAWFWGRRHALFPLSLSWFFIALLPTSSFLPLFDVASEHRTYIATPGLSMFFGLALSRMFIQEGKPRAFAAKTGAMILALFCFCALVVERNTTWNTTFDIWADAARKSPWSPRVHNNLALGYVAKNRIHEAIREYQISLRMRPSGETYNNLAMAYVRLGFEDKAVQTYEDSIKWEPDLAASYYKLGVLLQDMGDYEKATEYYQKALARNGRYPEAYNNLGHVYLMRNQMEKARMAFEKAIEIRPFHPESLNNLGVIRQRMGDFIPAEQYFLKALAFNPRIAQTHVNLGSLYLAIGKVGEAEKHLREAIRLDSRLEPAYAMMGDLFLQNEMFQESLQAYHAALAINADNSTVHRNLAIVYYNHLNDPKKALYHFRRTLELNPGQDHSSEMRRIIEALSSGH